MSIYDVCNEAGGMSAYEWTRDPKRLAFILARYKHTAKLLEGSKRVLEVGCADGFGSRIVRQAVSELEAIDIDAKAIGHAVANNSSLWPISFKCANILEDVPRIDGYDAVYALDLLEHFRPGGEEETFLSNISACAPVAVIGTPSAESQVHASELSRIGHVNCKTAVQLRETLNGFWEHVFLFGINDETLHTGFAPMCHYRLALCVVPR